MNWTILCWHSPGDGMTKKFKKLAAEVLALSLEEQTALVDMLLAASDNRNSGEVPDHIAEPSTPYQVAQSPTAYLVKGELPMEKKVRLLLNRLKHLSPAKQSEAADFIEFLQLREAAESARDMLPEPAKKWDRKAFANELEKARKNMKMGTSVMDELRRGARC